MNDYELLMLKDDEIFRNLLYQKYLKFINKIVKKYKEVFRNYNLDFNDLYVEALIGLDDAINNYNDLKNTSFFTFLYHCVTSRLNNYINKEKNKMTNLEILSLDEPFNAEIDYMDIVENPNAIVPSKFYEEESKASNLLKLINQRLSSNEKTILKYLLSNFKYEEIAKITNVNIKSVYNAMMRIRAKVKPIIV